MAHHLRTSWALRVPIHKAEARQGLVTGWASIVSTPEGTPIIDADGDVIPAEELEQAVQTAMLKRGGRGAVGDMHHPEFQGSGDLVESFVFTRAKYKALGIPAGPEGWAVTFKVDPASELMREIVAGRKAELSIKGSATSAQEVWIDGAA